jgi:amino acid transporter
VSGEVRDPQRTLPRALLLGTSAIVILYLMTNLAYLYVIPVEGIGESRLIAADAMEALFGQAGVALVSVVVMVSTFGALNGIMLASPRIFFAMAEDGLFFRQVATVHSRYRTPIVAILLAAGLGIAFVLLRTFEQLADIFVLAIWPFYGLAVGAVYRLRRTRPDLARPYRAFGYPIVPALFVLAVAYLIGSALVGSLVTTLMVMGAILAGVPVYYATFARAS